MSITKKILLTALCFVLSGSMLTTRLNAGVQLGLDFNSRYIWRGFDLNPNNEPVLQPSVTVTFGDTGLALNVWNSFSFIDSALHETDMTLSYDFSLNKDISVSIGFIQYGWYFTKGFSFKDNTTQEFYVTAGLANLPLKPSLSFYYDFNNGDGFYASLGVGHSLKLSGANTLELSATLGYNG